MKKFKIENYGKTYEVYPQIERYSSNNTLAIRLMLCSTYEPYCSLTKNLPNYTDHINELGFEYQFVDTNNFPNAIQFILENKLGTITRYTGYSGYCQYPVVKFDLKEFI